MQNLSQITSRVVFKMSVRTRDRWFSKPLFRSPTDQPLVFGIGTRDVSALSDARSWKSVEQRVLGRAFDTAVRRKPLAGAADAGCYGINRFLTEKPCQTGTLAKTTLLIFTM